MALRFKRDDYLKIVAPNGDYRFGYVEKVEEGGTHLTVCLHEEGSSKLAFEQEELKAAGEDPVDWKAILTPTEQHIVALLAQEMDTALIAESLSISPVTVRAHVRNLKLKLGISTRQQLVLSAAALEKALK